MGRTAVHKKKDADKTSSEIVYMDPHPTQAFATRRKKMLGKDVCTRPIPTPNALITHRTLGMHPQVLALKEHLRSTEVA